jgi:lipopolysaccharide biosynthesis glycosyltransferase
MKQTLHVAAACDQSYAMPLAVTLASLSANLHRSWSVRAHVLHRELPLDVRRKIEQSVPQGTVEINLIEIGASHLESLRATLRSFDTVSLESYYRLLLPEVLPRDLDKVIYLDSDLVVVGDLSNLWNLDVTATSLLAAPELAPASSLVSSPAGIRLYRELGLSPDLKFFNSGVMLVNLQKWRQDRVALQAFVYLEAAIHYLRWHDQEALNAVLAGDWRELDLRWNITMHIFRADTNAARNQDLFRQPYIVHFNSAIKPWQPDFSLGFRDLFFQYLDKTAWSGWRPDLPSGFRERLKKSLLRAAQKRYHVASSRAKILRSRVVNWWVVHSHVPRVDVNAIPSGRHPEVRTFLNLVEPCPPLVTLLNYYTELGTDRVFLLVDSDHVVEASKLSATWTNLHVFVKEKSDSRSAHFRLRGLLHRYGERNWCVVVNSNELLYYPRAEQISFELLFQYLDANGYDAVPGQLVDLQQTPCGELALHTEMQSPASRLAWWSDSRAPLPSPRACCEIRTIARDPVTERIFPASLLLDDEQGSSDNRQIYRSRVALFKFHRGMNIAEEFRAVQTVRSADIRSAVLRFAGGIVEPPPQIDRGEARQLLDRGILQSSPALDALCRLRCDDQH